eukprot:142305-Amorphochlora_amoeboformis.AAC.1
MSKLSYSCLIRPGFPDSPQAVYDKMVARGDLKDDRSQRDALVHIEELYNAIQTYQPPAPSPSDSSESQGSDWMSSILGSGTNMFSSRPDPPRGSLFRLKNWKEETLMGNKGREDNV